MKIKINNIYCEIDEFTKSQYDTINNALTSYAPGYRYSPMYKRKLWNGKVSLLKGNEFPTGCLPRLLTIIKGSIELVDNRIIPKLLLQKSVNVPLRNYQVKSINTCFSSKLHNLPWNRGIIKAATGAGKTLIAAAMLQVTKVPTLYIVDTQELLTQAQETFQSYNITNVHIMTIQSLMNFKHKTNKKTASGKVRTKEEIDNIVKRKSNSEEKVIDFLDKIEQVFIDEAHGIAASIEKGNMMAQALAMMPNAYMRWGLTATPFERDNYSNLILEGTTGDLLVEITAKELIEAGYLSAPNITMFYSFYENVPKTWPDCYTYGITLNDKRNDKIVEQATKLPKPCLITVVRKDHGTILIDKFKKAGLEVPFLSGSDGKEDRQSAVEAVRSGKLPIVIASKIWGKGLDMPNLRSVILAGADDSKINVKQIIGRGMRITKDKTHFHVVDFVDMNPTSLRNHSNSRKRTYLQEGYEVKVEKY